jgi:hypothetical protein
MNDRPSIFTGGQLGHLLKRHFKEVKVYSSYRIDGSKHGVKKKLATVKTYVLAFLFRKNELTTIYKKHT